MLAQADETAERIATLGGTPDGRTDAIMRKSARGSRSTSKAAPALRRISGAALIEYYDAFIADDRATAELTSWM